MPSMFGPTEIVKFNDLVRFIPDKNMLIAATLNPIKLKMVVIAEVSKLFFMKSMF